MLSEREQGIFIRGGSIIPIKLHYGKLSLQRVLMNPIRLEIYLDKNYEAEGFLYLDDGETFRYQTHNEKSLIKYTFKDFTLTYKVMLPDYIYEPAATELKISEVEIYGLKSKPLAVISPLVNHNEEPLNYDFNYEKGKLHITQDMELPIDDFEKRRHDVEVELLIVEVENFSR